MPAPARQARQRAAPASHGAEAARHATPNVGTAPGLLELQQTVGNQAVQRLLSGSRLQAKLAVGPPGDAFEQEADRVAERVVSSPAPVGLQRTCACGGEEGECAACREEGESLQRRSTGARAPTAAPPIVEEVLSAPGRPLEPSVRGPMESQFGRDFSAVRLHTDERAAASARAVDAHAYTVGRDVVFAEGRFQPRTDDGLRLLTHELTHVAQQGCTRSLGSLGSRHLSISSSAGTARVFRQIADLLDYRTIARQIHDAIAGLGNTDEDAVYAALQRLERDPTAISSLEARYLADFHETLEDAIRGDFSGEELEYALQLINRGTAASAQRIEPAPTTPAGWEASARRIRTAVEGLGTDEEAIYAVLRPLDRDPGKIDQLTTTYRQLFNEDLATRLRDEMSESELAYALFLLRLGPSHTQETLTGAAEAQVGQRMTWTPSSPGGGNDFERWASSATEGTAPAISTSTTINCWEMILLIGHREGLVSWEWIHQLYTQNTTPLMGVWVPFYMRMMSRGPRIVYNPGGSLPQIPTRGDIVFFDGPQHVALATGRQDSMGRAEVISFWPPPDVVPFAVGTIDQIKVTTIEQLVPLAIGGGAGIVEFATPPW